MNKGEIRLIVVIIFTVSAILFSKYILGGYENETSYIICAIVIPYFLFDHWKREKRKKQKR
jgi:ABC-type Fe3+-siderophore transport system permease subunit